MQKTEKNYYVGLDIGSNSIGWAVTDDSHNILKYRNKSMWGVRLVEEAKTAVERRTFRANRRRLARRKERIRLLQELFAPYINEVDSGFFDRLKESNLHASDRTSENNHIIFGKKGRSDSEFFADNPTAYHLRRRIMDGIETDIRAVYLAVHHIIKYRGHFLLEGQEPNVEKLKDAKQNFVNLSNSLADIFEDFSIHIDRYEDIENVLLDSSIGKRDKKKKLFTLLFGEQKYSGADKNSRDAIINTFFGDKVSLSKLFANEEYDDGEVNCFEFSSSVYEDSVAGALQQLLGDNYTLIESLKAVYDWVVFRKLLKNYDYISDSMIAKYNKHKDDLSQLKGLLREHYSRADYKKIFGYDITGKSRKNEDEEEKSKKEVKNYSNYIGSAQLHNVKYAIKKISDDELYVTIKKVLEQKKESLGDNLQYQYIMNEMAEKRFLPKQLSTDNGVIPYQFNLIELRKIIDRFDIFKTVIDGMSFGEKLEKLLTFRVPYYVGPLNISKSYDSAEKGYAWAVRKDSPGQRRKVTPWNFDSIIDREESANRFIRRMTNQCTYLKDCDVIPAKSILYSEFMLLNELNKLKINGHPIEQNLKNRMIKEVFLSDDPKYKSVTVKKLLQWLVEIKEVAKEDINLVEISGVDSNIKASLASRKNFARILGSNEEVDRNIDMVEDIIRWHTVFGEKEMVVNKIKAEYPSALTDEQIKQIKQLNFDGWSSLSRELLTEIKAYDHEVCDGECFSIMDLLRSTNMNFMEILHSDRYKYLSEIDKYNGNMSLDKLTYADVDELYCSPKVKRVIWQSLRVVEELERIMKCPPARIFIEMARDLTENNEKKRTVSRKQQLQELYRECGDLVDEELASSLDSLPEERLKKDQIFLYYLQLGRSVYSGKHIDLDRLLHEDKIYDIDHIRPRAIVKDDSVLNNKVLVLREENAHKSDLYPLPQEYQTEENKRLWKSLVGHKLMTKDKYERLMRTTPLSEVELAAFIERQLVDTRQSTKEVAKLFRRLYGDNTDIVYVKAGLTSEFRYKYHMVKVRELNDLHHAKDAYLNIVVGDLYDTVFTRNALKYVQEHPRSGDYRRPSYSFETMFDWEIKRQGKILWDGKEGASIGKVKQIYGSNDVLVTRMQIEQKGAFYDMNLSTKGEGLAPPTENKDNPLHDTAKYGGYNNVRIAYYYLAKHEEKRKVKYSIESVPVYMRDRINGEEELRQYAISQGLQNPQIIVPKIRVNSLLCYDGTEMYLTGKSGSKLLVEKSTQVYIDERLMEPLKHILKFADKVRIAEKAKKQVEYSKYDGFKQEALIELYDTVTVKLGKPIFAGLSTIGKYSSTFAKKRDKFLSLSIEKQAILLSEMIHFVQANNLSSDLQLIGEAKFAGKTAIGKNVAGKRLDILYPSVTGLYLQKKVNLTES